MVEGTNYDGKEHSLPRERFTQRDPTPNPELVPHMSEQESEEGHAEPENMPDPPQLSLEGQSEQQSDKSLSDHHDSEREDVVDNDSGPNAENSLLYSPVAPSQRELRRSTRERRPKQFFTYETLGEPTVHLPVNANSMAAYTEPYTTPTQSLAHVAIEHTILVPCLVQLGVTHTLHASRIYSTSNVLLLKW